MTRTARESLTQRTVDAHGLKEIDNSGRTEARKKISQVSYAEQMRERDRIKDGKGGGGGGGKLRK